MSSGSPICEYGRGPWPLGRPNRFYWALLVLLVVGLYWRTLDFPFQYDDIHSIVENPHIRTADSLPRILVDPTLFSADSRSAMYRPAVLLSYVLNYSIGGLQALAFRWTNLSIHILCALMVGAVTAALTGNRSSGLLSAAFFCLHPLNTETVVYISSRSESLCALFYLGALWAYLHIQCSSSQRRWLWRIASYLSFGLALLSKSVALTLPLVLLLVEIARRPADEPIQLGRTVARLQWPFWLLGALYVMAVRDLLASAVLGPAVRARGAQLGTQLKALVFYLYVFWMPTSLSVEHGFVVADGETPAVLFSGLLLASLIAVLARRRVSRTGSR